MEKKLEDYLHYYLGVRGKLSVKYHDGEEEVDAVLNACFVSGSHSFQCFDLDGNKWEYTTILPAIKFRPFLRPLNEMTDDEAKTICNFHFETDWEVKERSNLLIYLTSGVFKTWIYFNDSGNLFDHEDATGGESAYGTFEAVHYLLSKHFDIYELIPEGLAIDKTKYIQEQSE